MRNGSNGRTQPIKRGNRSRSPSASVAAAAVLPLEAHRPRRTSALHNTPRPMNLFVATLNVGNRPLEPDQLNRWLREAKNCDVCIVCLQEAHVVTDRHMERSKSVAALLAAGALAWPTWGLSCCLAIPYVCRQRQKREERHEKELAEARALSNPSLSPQQKRARVTLGSSRRIRDSLHHLGFSVRKRPSLAWGQLRCFVQRLVFFVSAGRRRSVGIASMAQRRADGV